MLTLPPSGSVGVAEGELSVGELDREAVGAVKCSFNCFAGTVS